MSKTIDTEIKVEPATINDLKQTGRIIKGFLHLSDGRKIRAKGGTVEKTGNNGNEEKFITLKREIYGGNTFVTGIKVA